MKRLALLFAAFAALLASTISGPALAQPEFPALSGRVVDTADIIPADVEAQLTAKLEALETQSQRQLVVTTVPNLQGYDISDYGYQLGREWGLGDGERNDGALLIVAPNDRKVRIEVGYGLEGYLTDALSSVIIQNEVLPRFRDGDMPGGIVSGTDAIIAQLVLPPDEAAKIAAEATQTRQSDGGFPFGFLIWIGFMFFFFVLPIIRGSRRRRKYRSKGKGPWGARGGKRRDDDDDDDDFGNAVGNIILWEIGTAIARGAMSGGGGGGGGWGGGGGGFSGGGGSFGGGGASGGW
ncbi:MAG: TPM domain-containing protein [Erythrobacter sp.]|uniref:TPM domain-containing protein n=1 Tax=Erythrobacter sp. TaxID=1042 RepID=UPI003298DB33